MTSEQQGYNQAIYEIFRGNELTRKDNGNWILNNYDPRKSIRLGSRFCTKIIFRYGYLEMDSGNWHTGEKHYRLMDLTNLKTKPYDSNKDMLRRNLRKVRMHRLLK